MNSYRNNRIVNKEQYYTNADIAEKCVKEALKYVKNDLLVEPCGGTGEFVKHFENTSNLFSAFDIEPKYKHVEELNFFDWKGTEEKFSIITNPPYGRNNSLSVRFFNYAASLNANYICFLIPISWRKWNIQNRLDNNYHLVKDIEVTAENMFYGEEMNNKKGEMRCIFQIWERRSTIRKKIIIKDNGYLIRSTPEEADVKITHQSYESKILEITTDFKKIKIPGNFYYKIKNKEVIDKVNYIRKNKLFKKFTDYSMYFTKSISFDELNYLLNEL